MPTAFFFVYLLMLGAAWLFRLSYSGWFGFYLLLAMIAVPLLVFALSLPAMLSLKLKTEVRPYITRGSEGDLMLRFQSRRFFPVGSVKVLLLVENRFAGESYRIPAVYHGITDGEKHISLPTDLCGQLRIRVQRFECRDMLGLFCLRRKAPEALVCAILPPAVAPDHPVDLEAALKTVTRLKPKYGGGFSEEHDLRDYRPGDMSNSIHWKLSSKADKLIVREALEQENKEIFLVLNQVGKDDRGLEVLYWLSLELCQRELPHRIVSNTLYLVGNENESASALAGILAFPLDRPCSYDASTARSVFVISSGEVTAL